MCYKIYHKSNTVAFMLTHWRSMTEKRPNNRLLLDIFHV